LFNARKGNNIENFKNLKINEQYSKKFIIIECITKCENVNELRNAHIYNINFVTSSIYIPTQVKYTSNL
jgi:hypothetical protein